MKRNVFFNLIFMTNQVIEHLETWAFNEIKNFPEEKWSDQRE